MLSGYDDNIIKFALWQLFVVGSKIQSLNSYATGDTKKLA
jgi:hypothetical protein